MDHRVTIVIIGRNEAAGIAKCIDAATAAALQLGGAEMIYVDSNSTDDTVTIVVNRGIKALPLPDHLRQTPSAGRFWGSQHATGEFILFLDADTLIYPDFLPEAISYLDRNPIVGALNGFIDDQNEAGEPVLDIDERFDGVANVKWLRGPACLYRRAALMEAGSFDPELATEEEAELGLRIAKRGWELKIIPTMMACHTRCYHPNSLAMLLATFDRDIRSGRLGEVTRTIARAFEAGNGMAFCWLRLNTTVLFTAWVIAFAGCFLLPASLSPWAFALGSAILGAVALSVKKRSVTQAALFVPAKLVGLVDLLVGVPYLFTRKQARLPLNLARVETNQAEATACDQLSV